MKFRQYLTEAKTWGYPTEQDMKSDFAEYKKKEFKKWESRAKQYGFRFPVFNDYSQYKSEIRKGKIINLTSSFENRIPSTTYCETIDCIKNLVAGYIRPRDVDRIVNGFENNNTIPFPIILKGKKGYFRLAGNTRMNVARVMDIPVKVLVIDVSK